jgi:branched-chain amino acid aminotransferase
MNVFLVRGRKILTPPVTDNILEGITRRTIIELSREEMGLEVIERPIDRTEVYLADELFMTGTAAQIVAATRVDYRSIGNGSMGPVTTELRRLFDAAVRGYNPRFRNWNVPVYASLPVVDPLKTASERILS